MSSFRQQGAPQMFPEPVKHIIIINVLVFAIQNVFPQYNNMIVGHYFLSPEFRPWQIITHMFAHADLSHLLFNMFSFWMFGRILASIWDEKRFYFFYFTCGLFAFFCHQLYLFTQLGFQPIDSVMLGASGAVYGILVGYATLFPNTKIFLLFPPIPLKAKYMIGAFVLFDLFYGVTGRADGIAHFAHLGGALAGFLLIKYWQKNTKTFY